MRTSAPDIRRFDRQARTFEHRAGLGRAGGPVADALCRLVGLGPHDTVLEVGAGTGAVGRHLATRCRYVGLEGSAPMLDRFRSRLPRDASATLLQADCDRPWPVDADSAQVVLASRVVHLLDREHFLDEANRVATPGGLVLLGRVVRDASSPKEQLRACMHQELVARGLSPRDRRGPEGEVLQGLVARGGSPIADEVLAEWITESSPLGQIESWAVKDALGGVELEPWVRDEILASLRRWAQGRFGDLARTHRVWERYAVVGARMPQTRAP